MKRPRCEECDELMIPDDERDMGEEIYYSFHCKDCKLLKHFWKKKK